jgi:hypothetical protein
LDGLRQFLNMLVIVSLIAQKVFCQVLASGVIREAWFCGHVRCVPPLARFRADSPKRIAIPIMFFGPQLSFSLGLSVGKFVLVNVPKLVKGIGAR